jgi:hypothetical protein
MVIAWAYLDSDRRPCAGGTNGCSRDPAGRTRITEALKRLCDNDRSLILNWLILYYEDDGRMRSPRAKCRSTVLDDVPYYLVRIVRKGHASR